MHRILVIEDDRHLLRSLAIALAVEGYEVIEAPDYRTLLSVLEKEAYDLVLTDLRMEGMGGLEVLRRVKQVSPSTEVIMMTAFGTVESAVEAMKEGACDYLTKPFSTEELLIVARRALEKATLRREVDRLRRIVDERYGFEKILTADPEMRRLLKTAQAAARTDATVLILGDSGTGKELVASAIHYNSSRHDRPLIVVNCGALPAELIESELFGHAKGAFTSAIAKRKGLIEEADTGSIFLDEIAEVPPSAQVALLRFLENGEIRRVGENVVQTVNVRVIAATNRDLRSETLSGGFREDLFYRLNVISFKLPALRERRTDIPLLAQHFLDHYRSRFGKPVHTISPDAAAALLCYPWPGNVRELENAIERAVALSEDTVLRLDDLPAEIAARPSAASPTDHTSSTPSTPSGSMKQIEMTHILDTLRENQCNRRKACEALQISRSTLYRRLKDYGRADLTP